MGVFFFFFSSFCHFWFLALLTPPGNIQEMTVDLQNFVLFYGVLD